MYQAVTRGIRVTVVPEFLGRDSRPDEGFFLWAYRIEIENRSPGTVRLLRRHWIITDGRGRVQDVQGEGVVGQQPALAPGQRFSYASGCPLGTPDGTMRGSYVMSDEDDNHFEVEIPLFALDSPHARTRLH